MNAIMTPQPKKRQIVKTAQKCCDLTRNQQVISRLKDVTPSEIGNAVSRLCTFFVSIDFREIVLNPFTAYPIDYHGEVIDVPGIGQLRYNTEPEIWEHS